MKILASFDFDNAEAPLPRENIVKMGDEKVVVRMFRRMRTEPLPGMKQPLLNAAIMGLETVLEILVDGKPAVSHCWKLYLNSNKLKFIQSGVTDQCGCSGDVFVGFDSDKYRLVVLSPKLSRRKQVCSLRDSSNS